MASEPTIDTAQHHWPRAGLEEIPVLDLGDYLAGKAGAAEQLGAGLRDAQERIGFFYIHNHGVPQDLIDRMFAETSRFHAQPLDRKTSIKIDEQQTGYAPMQSSEIKYGDAVVDGRHKPDLSEALWLRRDIPDDDPELLAGRRFRRNKWPEGLPGFRDTVGEYMVAMEQLGRRMLPLYALALDLPADYFAPFFVRADIPCRFGHYPAHLGGPDHFGAAPHTDAGFMTLLPQAKEAGLEIFTRSKRWIPAPVRPGDILVNGGNCLVRFTNGRFLATPHRVVGGLPRDRYSIPLFYNPAFDAVVAPVPTCARADGSAGFAPIRYEDYIAGYLASVYAHQARAAAREQSAQHA
ncbi:2-oxoglutarate and iron-dependent oxygenase domain-containing protein [Sphingomonas naphthae]|uniref:2-oxoglutarate-dependent ethylene/succinate-forming enzyme n=1 Tax=Sphingomonas naphthae TaxID=1813468 RepID=A0ABY7TN64_9SPHN|nr:2-oxoglutarate and iron-dependent oxygenase domain-containing protein [Sphingomonas naphthae]WCT74473.1 2-oxoglutarate and iron-dependent oxygenase domain-containing protein [Sphingomonas naphthae]